MCDVDGIDLPVAKVVKSKKDKYGRILITIETTEDHVACRVCGKNIYKVVGTEPACTLKHVPVFGVATFIIYNPRQYICEDCESSPITTAPLLWDAKDFSSARHMKSKAIEKINIGAINAC